MLIQNIQEEQPAAAQECDKINQFLKVYALIAVGEMATCFLLTVGIPSIMRSANWAMFGLTSLLMLFIVYTAKLGGLVMGIVLVWGVTDISCSAATPSLYDQASAFLICMIVFYAFQLLFGTSFLMCCGLEDAVGEGFALVNQRYVTSQPHPFFSYPVHLHLDFISSSHHPLLLLT